MPKTSPPAGSHEWVLSLAKAVEESHATPASALDAVLDEVERECPICQETLADYPRALLVARAGGDYEAAVDAEVRRGSARAIDLARERSMAPEQIDAVMELAELADAAPMLALSPQHHRWGLAMLMLELCDSLVAEDPQAALAWGRVGLTVATALDPARYGLAVVADARAAAHTHVARSLLAAGARVGEAREEVDAASDLAGKGTGSPAVVLEVAAARMELAVASGAWREAIECYEGLMESPVLAAIPGIVLRTTASLSQAYRQGGLTQEAIRALRGALRAAEPVPAEELLARAASLDLIATLCDLARPSEAAAQLEDYKARFTWRGPPRLAARALWMEARVLALSGMSRAALLAFDLARVQLLEAGDPLAAARATVDQLLLIAAVTRVEPGAALAEPLTWLPEVLERPGIPRWAMAGVLRLLRAAHEGNLSVGALESVREFLAKPSGSYSGVRSPARPVIN